MPVALFKAMVSKIAFYTGVIHFPNCVSFLENVSILLKTNDIIKRAARSEANFSVVRLLVIKVILFAKVYL